MAYTITEYTIAEHLYAASERLSLAGCDTPRLDAELLLSHALGRQRSWLYAYLRTELTARQVASFHNLLQRREQREPVAYIIGYKAFYGLDFQVNHQVLIPRPETELLVETALEIPKKPKSRLTIADVGTGSGCIAIVLAKHFPQATIFATDISPAALEVARQNSHYHQTERIFFFQGDLLSPLPQPVDLIVSNPPYVTTTELRHEVAPEVSRFEPSLALDGGVDGLSLISRLLTQAQTKLKPQGHLLVEIGAGQGPAVRQLAQRAFPRANFTIKPDLARRNRLLVIQNF